jgi:hypothetical protein
VKKFTRLLKAARHQYLDLLAYLLFFGFFYWLFNNFIATLPVTALDDTCVYFNYAKNIVDGNWFAYDARNLPSEGFTSLIFLLLLALFKYFSLNLLFAAIMINLFALVAVIWFGLLIYQTIARTEHELFSYLFLMIFSTFLVFDPNIATMIGMGFESLLSPALIFAAFYLLLVNYQPQIENLSAKSLNKSIISSFILLFFAILVRPENLLIMGVFTFMALWMLPRKRVVIYGILLFGMCLASYLIFKFMYFGDIFPTAYYRKLNEHGALVGYYYVVNTLTYYLTNIFIIIMLLITAMLFERARATHYFLIFTLFALSALIISGFFLFVSPIVGYGGRFLVIPIILIHFSFACLLTLALEQGFKTQLANNYQLYSITTSKGLLILLPVMIVLFVPMERLSLAYLPFDPIHNFYQTVKLKFANHPYVKFGNFLKTHLQHPQQVTLVFGDAGCIPYTSNLRFIDPNGLTEPYIAHLFRISDKTQIVKPFTDYILHQHPDIIVIGYGHIDNAGISFLAGNPHSPFGKSPQLAEFKAYRESGFEYLCSLPNASFDVHLAVQPNSPQAAQVIPVLLEYCHANGYFLPTGLTKHNKFGDVFFPRYVEK